MKILNIVVIVLLLLCILFCSVRQYYSSVVKSRTFWKNKYGCTQKKIVKLLREIIPYLNKHNITYWIHSGTLIGALRHKGFIPWDDDVDMGYIADDNTIKKFKEDLEKKYKIVPTFFGFKIKDKDDGKIFIDMMTFKVENDKIMQTHAANLLWPSANYSTDELFPIKTTVFENIRLPVPNKSVEICKRRYGNNFMNEYKVVGPHDDALIENPIEGICLYTLYGKTFDIKELHD